MNDPEEVEIREGRDPRVLTTDDMGLWTNLREQLTEATYLPLRQWKFHQETAATTAHKIVDAILPVVRRYADAQVAAAADRLAARWSEVQDASSMKATAVGIARGQP